MVKYDGDFLWWRFLPEQELRLFLPAAANKPDSQ